MGTRVGAAAPGAPKASPFGVANDGEPLIPAQDYRGVRKRALRRAIRRAQRSGATMYRGKALHANVSLPLPKVVASPASTGPRVKVFSWNCDGLSAALYAEILCWLGKHTEIDIIFLQETHWSKSMEWSTGEWHFCHSASLRRNSAGVLIGVRASFAKASTISWQESLPGRLLQVRCFHGHQHIDLICGYQHALGFGDRQKLQHIYQKRRAFWSELGKLLSSLPYRSHVVLGGDFNCSVTPLPKLIGSGVLAGPNTEAANADRRLFLDILQAQQLCILNSWSGKLATYHHPKGRSQIDFLAVRVSLADTEAKSCKPAESFLAGWRSAGHKPLVSSIKLLWKPWSGPRVTAAQAALKAASELGFGTQPVLRVLHAKVGSSHAVAGRERPSMPVRESSHGLITGFWQLRRRVSQLRWSNTRGIFLAWRLAIRLQASKRALERHLRHTKRAHLLAVLEQAEQAAQRKLTGGFYKFVNLLCPKSHTQRIRLRDQAGQLVDQQAECSMLAAHARRLFLGRHWTLPVLLPVPAALFSSQHWWKAFCAIPRNKAVPIFTPSINAWKGHASEVCGVLEEVAVAQLATRKPCIPAEWASVQIAWLPKPNKTPSSPENLRTIGLMSGDQKALLHIIKTHITEPIMKALHRTPQYAYRKGASTLDAILRSSEHCHQVRKQLDAHRSDLTTKLSGRSNVDVIGGLMANIDLSKAFDSLPYEELYLSLQGAGVDEPLCRLILHLHARTSCVILHGSCCETVPMSRGLRQGCPIAPLIFAAWSIRICKLIDGFLGQGWSLRHLTLFSDDTHCYWHVHSAQELERAIQQLSRVIAVLTEAGMSINFSKSAAVCGLKGKGVAAAQQRHFRWRDGALHLRLRRDTHDLFVPLGDSLEYLGITLSYHNFQLQTVKMRQAKAQANFARLHKVLRVNGPLSAKQRLRVYAACVLSCFLYGLLGVGLSASCFRLLFSGVCGHLRKVLRIHQEGVTNAQVLERAGIDLAAMLRTRAESLRHTINTDAGRDPELKDPEARHIAYVIEGLDAALEVTPSALLTRISQHSEAVLDCPVCGQYFSGSHNLVMHFNAKHPELNQTAKIPFVRHKHALHGIPRCRFCRATLFSWQVLEQHLTCGMCPRLKDGFGRGFSLEQIFEAVVAQEYTDPPEPPPRITASPSLLFDRKEHESPIHDVLDNKKLFIEYASTCALCSQKLQSAHKMKSHWRSSHISAWLLVERETSSLARSLSATFRNPCPYCASTARDLKAHCVQCPALFQVLAVRYLRSKRYTVDELQKESGPGKRQSERRAAYLDFDSSQMPLCRAFRNASVPQSDAPTEDSTHKTGPSSGSNVGSCFAPQKPANKRTPDMFKRFQGATATHQSVCSDSAQGSPSMVSNWCCSLRLANPHTQCYVNACILALGHAVGQRPLCPTLNRVFQLCQAHPIGQGPLHLAAHRELTALLPEWYFGIRQQDASEFLEALLRLDFSCIWSARVWDEGLRFCDSGMVIGLSLADPPDDLQGMLYTWHNQQFKHALDGARELICLQFGRYPHLIKNSRRVCIPSSVAVPVFVDALSYNVTWVNYRIESAVIHLGRRPTSGHYRALLQVGRSWYYTNDHVAAKRCTVLPEHERGCYLLLLIKAPVL